VFPRLFEIGGYSQPTYGVLVALGVMVGLFVTARMAQRQGQDPEDVWNLGILVVLAAIVGAKVLLVIDDFGWYMQHPREIFSLSTLQAGGVFYGGVITALVVSIWYIRKHRMPWLRTADAFAPGLALGHSIGRLGCFAAGCCYGKHTDLPWGVTFSNPVANLVVGTPLNIPLHPTQIYEFLVEVGNFLILLWLYKHKKFDGQVIGAYLFLYGFARYFLEFLRDDPGRGSLFGGAMSGAQFVSIFMVILGGVLWMKRAEAPAAAPAGR
jgi:phosphatidylglycerol:prolipoprotein diacylglycerol transferase